MTGLQDIGTNGTNINLNSDVKINNNLTFDNANGNDMGLDITPIALAAFPVLNPEFIVPAKPKATISSVLTLNGIVPFCEERHGFTKSNSFVEQALIPKRLGPPVGLIVSPIPK